MDRIAYCAPLPPAATGIADYAAEQISDLAGLVAEVCAYHPRGLPAAPIPGVVTAPIDRLEEAGPFDAVLIHLGNHAGFHRELFELALRQPSVVVLHEVDLRHLVVGSTLGAGDPGGWLALLRRAYGAPGEAAGRRWLEQGSAAGLRDRPLFEPVVDASRGVVVHTAWGRDRVLAARPRAAIRVVPHPLPVGASTATRIEPGVVRSRLGIQPESLMVGMFGSVTAAKRLHTVLLAFQLVRRHVPIAQLVVIGDRGPYPPADELLAGPLGDGVVATGRVPLDDLLSTMAAVDVAVSLRHPPGGEASGAALRLLGLGRPLVTSDSGWCAEIPEGAAVHVAPDRDEVANLAAAMLALAGDPDLRRSVGHGGLRWARSQHAPDRAARTLVKALTDLSALEPPHPETAPEVERRRLPDATLVGAVGRALAELGVQDDDSREVEIVTRRLRELSADPP